MTLTSSTTLGTKTVLLLDKWNQQSVTKRLIIILGLAMILRIAWVLIVQTIPVSDFDWYHSRAVGLAEGKGYVLDNGEPTAYKPIGYPLFLSILYRLFGDSWAVGQTVNVLLGTATTALTFVVARTFLNHSTALLAALLIAINPTQIAYTSILTTEPIFGFLLIATLALVIRRNYLSSSWLVALAVGALVGYSILIRSTLLGYPAVLAIALLYTKVRILEVIRFVTVLAIVLFLVLLPWLIRNDQLVGGPTVGTVGGEVFWTANGPHSTGTYVELTDFDPLNELPDGYERDRLGYQLGIEYITKNPIEWITLLPKKFYHLWASDLSGFNWATSEHGRNLSQGSTNTLKVLSQTMWIALVLLILLATTHSAFRQLWFRGKGVIFPLILLYWSSVHLVLFGDGRYHVPLHPIVSIVAASAIMIGLNAWRKRSKQKNQSQLSEQL